MYDSDEQAGLRLNGTIVGYDKRPVQVAGVKNLKLNLIFLPKGRDNVWVALGDPKLNINNIKLGYVNVNNHAVYITRIPARQQKQGLCKANVAIQKGMPQKIGMNFNDIVVTPEFADAFQNIYPTFQEVVDRLYAVDELESMAFSRKFALHRDKELGFFELYYRGQKVAWGDPTHFNLPSSHTYLTELIAQEGIHVR